MATEDRCSSVGTVLISFLAGAAFGSGLALLFAPKSGREVREQIKDLSHDTVGRMKECTRDVQEKIKTSYDEGKEFIKEKKTVISSSIEGGKEAIGKEWKIFGQEQKKAMNQLLNNCSKKHPGSLSDLG
jgi:gas vesicle protein